MQQPQVSNTISPLLKCNELFLEDEKFDRADDFCEQVLNTDPENAEAQAAQIAAMAEATVMQAKGYNQKDVLQAEVEKKIKDLESQIYHE